MSQSVASVSKSPTHSFSKVPVPFIKVIAGLGVEGDCHAGRTVQHPPQCQITPPPVNLRQVHLLPMECLREVSAKLNKPLSAGDIGENVTTEGIDLLSLPRGTELRFSSPGVQHEAIIVLTGVRNPGPGFDKFRPGIKEKFVRRDSNHRIIKRLAGVMGVVKQGGMIKPGMKITSVQPGKSEALAVV
ncbi:PK beta-barrel-protein domain-containing protein-like protein [Aspergillus cavernicola]|uniref:PK beta-barrel-protein domain-containing protein-like protein n=1 Tax=Aspergillus cavernicola TaxID=176166 RepID=A0ABR4I9J9_9EURO